MFRWDVFKHVLPSTLNIGAHQGTSLKSFSSIFLLIRKENL